MGLRKAVNKILDDESNDSFILGELLLPVAFGIIVLIVLGAMALTGKL